MIRIKGLQVFSQSKYEKLKAEILENCNRENNQVFGLISRAYLDEKRGTLKSCFEKNTIDYFKDVLIQKSNSLNNDKNYLGWYKNVNEILFFDNMSKIINEYGSFETAYNKGKKDFKMKKNGGNNPIFSVIFDNNKKIIIVKENKNLFISPYVFNKLDYSSYQTKRDVFFEYYFFEDNNLFHIERKNKTLLIENIIENKFNLSCKKIKN